MNDDIVTQLRTIAKEMTTLGQAFDCLRVADIIEQLQTELAQAHNQIKLLSSKETVGAMQGD